MIVLRDDQLLLKQGIYSGWQSGKKNILAVLPTGGGKTVVFSDIAYEKNKLGAQQAIIAHRTELVAQMSMHVARRGVKHRVIAPRNVIRQISEEHRKEFNGYSFITPNALCSVTAVDTLIARQSDLTDWAKQVQYWTIDEAHHVLVANKWGKAAAMFANALGLGVTATPQRADGAGLGIRADGVFYDMVLGPSMRDLINMGALTDYEIVIPASDFQIDDDAITATGDYSQKKMREASKRSHIVGDVVIEYCKYALGKRGIVFATDVETANEIAKNFQAYGINAVSISAKTPAEVRSEYIRRFRSGDVTILVNVDLFGEGFDVPAVEVVIMARPTASLGVYMQQFGRVLRTMEGKKFGLVIDHVSNWKRHGFPDQPRKWTLDRREKRKKKEPDPEMIELVACLNCSRPYERVYPICPHCGFSPPVVLTGGRGDLEKVDGDLILLDRDTLEKMRAETVLESPASVGQRVGMVAGEFAAKGAINRQIERIQEQQKLSENIAQWAGIQRSLGRKDQESYRRFYLTAGVDVLTALTLGREEMSNLNAKITSWISEAM